jgi:hypothetical protein
MRDYFKRLRHHPGLTIATLMTIVGFLAGASNKHMNFWSGGIMGLIVMGGFCWTLVLLSNIKRKG